PLKHLFRSCRLQIQWAASKRLRSEVSRLSSIVQPSCLLDTELARDGVIISLGAGWGTDYLGVSALARKYNCKVVSFVHDIFPVTMPEYTAFAERGKNIYFRNWLHHIAKESFLIFCNSSFTKTELGKYLSREGIDRDIDVMPLAHEFKVLRGSAA